jgi:hypothetical protein
MVGFFFSGGCFRCTLVATMPRKITGTHMNTDSNAMARPSPQQEADAALQAITGHAKAENLSRVAELSEGTDEAHVAEHIRGMGAATMGHLSADAPAITRDNAEQWQDWALGVADGVAQTVPAAV